MNNKPIRYAPAIGSSLKKLITLGPYAWSKDPNPNILNHKIFQNRHQIQIQKI